MNREAHPSRRRTHTGTTNPGFTIAVAIGLALSLSTVSSAQSAAPKTDDEKAFYAIGTALAGQLEQFKPITDRELELVLQGMRDLMGEKVLAVEQQAGGQLIRNLSRTRQEKAAQLESAAAAAFLATEEKKVGAKRTASGLIITHLKPGAGPSPTATDTVRVHYHGTLRDGSVFDSSVQRGTPAEFPLNRVIPCWTEGVAMMKVGGKARLVCPASIAYGNGGSPPRILPGAALAFDVELLEIVRK